MPCDALMHEGLGARYNARLEPAAYCITKPNVQ
jgi:hypothetical protein